MIRKYILNGGSYVLNDDQHFRLKEEICEHFHVEFNNVILVGSGKLGFSIKSGRGISCLVRTRTLTLRLYQRIFQRTWEEAYLYKKLCLLAEGNFILPVSVGRMDWPDKLPSSDFFSFTATWWDFFNGITVSNRYGPYKIRGGLYHSMFFLQEYQKICIDKCIEELS